MRTDKVACTLAVLGIVGTIAGVIAFAVLTLVCGMPVICLFAPCDGTVLISGELQASDGGQLKDCEIELVVPPQRDLLYRKVNRTPYVADRQRIESQFEVALRVNPFVDRYQVVVVCPKHERFEATIESLRRLDKEKGRLRLGLVSLGRTGAQ
jgi:hypothetical protein